MKLYAARHGEATWNVEKRVLGNSPGELTENGKAQAKELARFVANLGIHYAYASDLKRVVETAEIIKNEIDDLSVTYTSALRERDCGELEGKLISEVDWKGFWALPAKQTLYQAESLYDFTVRIARFILKLDIITKEPILLISHIGVMNRLNYLANPSEFSFVSYNNAEAVELDINALTANSQALLDGLLEL